MMKRIIALLLSMILVIGTMPAAMAFDIASDEMADSLSHFTLEQVESRYLDTVVDLKSLDELVAYMETLTPYEMLLLGAEFGDGIEHGRFDPESYQILVRGGFMQKVMPVLSVEILSAMIQNPALSDSYKVFLMDTIRFTTI